MKLVSPSMEKAVIKLITTSAPKISYFALSKLRADHFGYPATQEAYERIAFMAKRHDEVMTWQELIADSNLAESSRDILAAYKKKVPDPTKRKVQSFVESLDNYRKMRVCFYAASETITRLKADKVDINKIIDDQYRGLSAAKSNSREIAKTIHYGTDNNSTYLIKNMLEGKTKPSIPTGLKAFDDKNVGFFFGSLVVLGGSSSGGKSAMALTIAKNMAVHGAKVVFIPLEQDEEETNQRLMANVAEIEMNKMINPKLMTSADKAKLKRSYKSFVERMKSIDSRLTVWKPEEDVSMDDIFFHLKPMGFNVYIIDYLGLTAGVGGDNAWQKLGEAARTSKIFASVNNCIVILLAQINDDLSVRYSRAITEHASNAFFWIRDQKAKDTHILNIHQRKARNQSDHSFNLLEEFQFMRVRDVPEGYTPIVEQQSSGKTLRKNKTMDQGDYFKDATQ